MCARLFENQFRSHESAEVCAVAVRRVAHDVGPATRKLSSRVICRSAVFAFNLIHSSNHIRQRPILPDQLPAAQFAPIYPTRNQRRTAPRHKPTMATKRVATSLGSAIARPGTAVRAGAVFARRQNASLFSTKATSSPLLSSARKAFVPATTTTRQPRWYSAGEGASVPGSKRWEFDDIKKQLENSKDDKTIFVGTYLFFLYSKV